LTLEHQQLLLLALLALPNTTQFKRDNVPTFILALATPGTNARSKSGGPKQSTRYKSLMKAADLKRQAEINQLSLGK